MKKIIIPDDIFSVAESSLVCDELTFVSYRTSLKCETISAILKSDILVYIIGGEKEVQREGKSFIVRKNEIALIGKGACLMKQFSKEETYSALIFILSPEFLSEFSMRYGEKFEDRTDLTEKFFCVRSDTRIKSCVDSLFPYFSEKGKFEKDIVKIKFCELLLNFIEADPAASSVLFDKETALASRIKNEMEKSIFEDISLEIIAKRCGISLSKFKSDFEKNFKTTPHKWIVNRRLDLAEKILKSTDIKIIEICQDSFFPSQSNFSVLFKKRYGKTPLEYRRKSTKTFSDKKIAE
ncbi:MAG TPA: AraC family transcriptional regulator [Spirochaetota bacterium]|nr:AraC family transcriptional regulator [Spirochaetota bacterium]HQO21573.1 AraC family transcriptional regulator [Spirochaetota bacterium]